MKYLAFAALMFFVPSAAFAQAPEPGEVVPITKLPKIKAFVEAIYPSGALRDRISGAVVLELDISAEGVVEAVGVVQTTTAAEVLSATTAAALGVVRSSTITDYGFVSSATTAASQFTFEPAEAEGTPVPVRISYTYNFALPPQPILTPPPVATSSTTEPKPGIMNFVGVVRERGTRAAVPGVIVTVFRGEGNEANGFEATSNAEGRFEFLDLDPGEWKILCEAPGYYPVRTAETIVVNQLTEVTYYIERGSYNPYEVVVEAARVIKEVNRRTLTAAEIVRVPGTLGDPVAVVTNLPGVARQVGGGLLIVRGSGPNDTGIFIDGIDVPLIYHFGGLKSVIPIDVVESIDFYPGNFSVQYGRATGGVFDAHIKDIAPDQIHGSLDVSILDTSLFLEIPLGDKASIALAGRRSYIDFILDAAVPDDASVNLISAPRYYDYQVLANWRPSAEHELRLFGLGSDDIFELLFKNPADASTQLQSGSLSIGTSFQRLMVEHRFTPNDKMSLRTIGSVGHDSINFSLGSQFRFVLDLVQFQLRSAYDWKLEDWLTVTAGIDYLGTLADVEVLAPRPPREGEPVGNNNAGDVLFTKVEGQLRNNIAPYVEAQMTFGDLQIIPGLRMDYVEDIDSFSVDPRIVARYTINPEWVAKGGAGVVHQAPEPVDTAEPFGNPNLGTQRGFQYSLGAEWSPLDYLKLDATVFYKDLRRLATRVAAPLNVDNVGTGEVVGFELFVKHNFNNNLNGWLSYTFSRAVRVDAPGEPSRLFDFDQTHILNLILSYVFPENWEVGLRWRLVSGNPYTPFIDSVWPADLDEYVPVAGEVNSARYPLFHQLDLRIDKTWVWDVWRLSAYLSLINSYNQTNTEGYSFNFDFTRRTPVQGLPILPILGLKGTF